MALLNKIIFFIQGLVVKLKMSLLPEESDDSINFQGPTLESLFQ